MLFRACIFIDGENFRNTIIDLFDGKGFSKYDYLPKGADWSGFFLWLVDKATENSYAARLIRTYWYVIEALDFYPYKLKEQVKQYPTDTKLLQTLKGHELYRNELNTLTGEDLDNRVLEIGKELQARSQTMLNRFNGWKRIHSSISTNHQAVQFRYTGSIKHDLLCDSLGREKAVDVKLACDLLMLRDIFDLAIIVSGDQDYVPAVEILKDSGKHVINVGFLTESGKILPRNSWRLNMITDWSINVPYGEFKKFLCIPDANT